MPLVLQLETSAGLEGYFARLLLGAFVSSPQGAGKLF